MYIYIPSGFRNLNLSIMIVFLGCRYEKLSRIYCIAIKQFFFFQDLALVTVSGLVAGSLNTTVLVYYCTDQLLNELTYLEAVLNSGKKKNLKMKWI